MRNIDTQIERQMKETDGDGGHGRVQQRQDLQLLQCLLVRAGRLLVRVDQGQRAAQCHIAVVHDGLHFPHGFWHAV